MVVWCVNYVILQHYILHLYLIFFVNMERIYYLCKIKQQQPKQTSPLIYNVMIIKHLQGDNRLLLPPSMQCVARLAIPAILFAMIICLTSCATARQGDEIKVYNKMGNGEQL